MQRQLLLASASPRRRELLALLGVAFDVRPPLREEGTPLRGEPVEEAVRRLALEKAKGVARGAAGSLVLGADTLVLS